MKIPAMLAVASASLLTLSACGSRGGSPSGGTTPASNHSTGIHTASTSLGKVLVDSSGMTVYVLSSDGHNHSTCNAQCLQFWPAVAPEKAATGVAAVGTTKTPAGTSTATVAGHPVYTFAQDQKPGDVNGEGVKAYGGTWWAVSATGQPVKSPSSGSSKSSGGGPYGGGY
jgi:predicted lipoprotein with Yx(FWY)xxD motif